MQTSRLASSDSQKLEDFLCLVNSEKYRVLAQIFIKRMFTSGEFRPPTFIVLKNGDDIIGTASYSEEMFTVGTWGISWVSVHPDWRKQGLGQKLVEDCLKGIAEAAAPKPVTALLASYPTATGLYERAGFIKAGEDHEGGWYMIRHLNT